MSSTSSISKPRLFLLLAAATLCALLISQWSSSSSPPQISNVVTNAQPAAADFVDAATSRPTTTIEPRTVVVAPEEDFQSFRFPPLLWTGGGVTGPSAEETRHAIKSTMTLFQKDAHDAACGVMLEDRSSEEHLQARDALQRVVITLSTLFTQQGLLRDDCWIHLTPQQRAMCAILSSVDDESEIGATTTVPRGGTEIDERRAYLSSYCSTMNPCLQWKAGRFSLPLNGSFLSEVYRREVVPLITEHDENRQAVEAVAHIFAHDEGNVDAEVAWIINRTILQEELLGRHQALFDAFQREVEHEKKHKQPLVLSDDDRRHLEWARTPVVGVTTAAFLGQKMTFDFAQREARVSSRETGEEVALQHFTPLQSVALLHHKVVAGYELRKQYRRPTAEDRDDRLMDEPTFRPYMNVIVFSGDSMNREFFLRLVFHIRFGSAPPRGNPYLRQTPFHEPSQQHDMIYSVFEDHDDLDVFHSLMSNGRSGRTVSAFFQKMKWDMRRWERFPTQRRPNVALFYVVYFWDPQTDYYRREMLPSLPLLTNTMHQWAHAIINATESLDDLAAGRGHLRIDDAHQRQKALRDSNEVAMIMPGQPCIVRLRMSNNAEKLIDVAPGNVQHLNLDHKGYHKLMLTRSNKGRMLQPASSTSKGSSLQHGGVTIRSGCSSERAAAAIRLRDTYLLRHRQRFATKPPTPLRDIGIRVPVHVQGNVFWEYVRNIQMTQHQYAALLATDDDVPSSAQLPRRATPKDQTELYMFSSSFHENLQPYLRGLSPFYRKFLEDEANAAAAAAVNGSATAGRTLSMRRQHDVRRQLENAADANDEDNGDAFDELIAGAGAVVTTQEVSHVPAHGNATVALPDKPPSDRPQAASLLQYLQQTYPGKPIKAILQQHRLTSETHHNLIKNVQQLLWFQSARDTRRQIAHAAARQQQRYPNGTARESLRTPFRYIESMTLLEMGKLQALGFVQGDTRHFSCRYTQVKDRIRFRSSFEAFGIRNVLSLGSHRANTEQRFCRLYKSISRGNISHRSGADGDGGDTGLNASPSAAAPHRPRSAAASLDDVVDMFVDLLSPAAVREALWKLTKMEEVEQQAHIDDPMVSSERIMHFQDYKEYGVIVHDDESRCVDDANLFLLEVLLNKMVLRDQEKSGGGS
jgi:hypothetical protein